MMTVLLWLRDYFEFLGMVLAFLFFGYLALVLALLSPLAVYAAFRLTYAYFRALFTVKDTSGLGLVNGIGWYLTIRGTNFLATQTGAWLGFVMVGGAILFWILGANVLPDWDRASGAGSHEAPALNDGRCV